MADPIDAGSIASTLFTTVKGQIEGAASGFLSSHQDVETFLLQAATRLGKAMFLHWIEKDPAKLALLAEEIVDEKDAILEESEAILKEIEDSSGSLVLQILKTSFGVAAAMAPLAIKLL